MEKKLWTIKIIFMAFFISLMFSFTTEIVMPKVNVLISIILLVLFIIIGIIFDMVGVAVTTCNVKAFHAMSSKKIKFAKTGIRLINNSAKVSSFCNDVIGDICGIVSGSSGVIISGSISSLLGINSFVVSLIITSLIAALTIGGKAYGKGVALKNSTKIVVLFSKMIYKFYK